MNVRKCNVPLKSAFFKTTKERFSLVVIMSMQFESEMIAQSVKRNNILTTPFDH